MTGPARQDAAPRGWNRPVRPGALVLVGGVVLVTWLAATCWGVWYFYQAWEARFTLRDQPVRLRLPAGMQALADVTSPVKTRLDLRPHLSLRIDQPVRVHLMDDLAAHARLDTFLPVDTTVQVDTVVPVRTTLDLSVSLKSWLPRLPVSVPVTVDLPVRLAIPVKAQVPIALDLDVTGALPDRLQLPVRTTLNLRPHVRGDVEVRLHATTLFALVQQPDPFGVRIAHADIRVPFNLGVRHRPLP